MAPTSQLLVGLLLVSTLLAVLGCITAPPPTAVREPTIAPTPTTPPTPTSLPSPTATPLPTSTPVPATTPLPASTNVTAATPLPASTLLPTATPAPTLQPSEAIAALEWVSDGVATSETSLVEQLELASATSQRYFQALMDAPWVRNKRNLAIWDEVVSELTQLAALDEDAALRALELELAEAIEYSDPITIGFLRSLASSDPEGMRRLLSHPSLDESDADGEDRFLPLLYLEMHDPDAAALVEALPWVQDGLKYPDFSYVVELGELARLSPRALQAMLREERDWLPPGPGAAEYPEALALINSVAALDEEAALRIIDMPFLKTIERPDFYALERLAALAASHPQQLVDVLAHPAVTAGDGALVGTIILLLDLRLRDPEASDALEGLPWVQEGIVGYMAYTASVDPEPLRQEAADVFDLLLLLEQGPSGRELFLTAVAKTWLQNGMTDHEREVVAALLSRSNMQWERAERIVRGQSLDAIATLPWTQRENELYESSDIRGLRGLIQLGGVEDDRVFWAVLDRPWVQDGLTSDEANFIEGLFGSFGKSSSSLFLWEIERNGDYDFGMYLVSLYMERHDPETAAALAALPWVQDGIDMTRGYGGEFSFVDHLLYVWGRWSVRVSSPEGQSWQGSVNFQDLLNKSWVRDEVEEQEHSVLITLANLPKRFALRLLPMPFLDTLEPAESKMLVGLDYRIRNNPGALGRLLDRPEYAEGLTDDNFAEAMALLARLLA